MTPTPLDIIDAWRHFRAHIVFNDIYPRDVKTAIASDINDSCFKLSVSDQTIVNNWKQEDSFINRVKR